jgi:hypothetical protein
MIWGLSAHKKTAPKGYGGAKTLCCGEFVCSHNFYRVKGDIEDRGTCEWAFDLNGWEHFVAQVKSVLPNYAFLPDFYAFIKNVTFSSSI